MNLSEVFIEHPFILADKDKLKNILADFYMGDIARVNRMMRAYEMGIVSSLSKPVDIDIEKKKIISNMISIHDMQEEKAKEAVEEWARVCSPKVITKYIEFIQDKKWSNDEESKIKDELKKQADLYDRINSKDLMIDDLVASQLHLLPEKWECILELCNEQKCLFDECDVNKWPIPMIKYRDLDIINRRFSTYQIMRNLDTAISSAGNDLSIKKNFDTYIECCYNQIKNITLCKQNSWQVPVLDNPEPYRLFDEARKNNQQRERIRTFKRGIRHGVLVIAILVVIVLLCIYKYRQARVQIPFDSGWPSGRELEIVMEELLDAGFENIELVEDTSGWGKSDIVLNVLINEKSDYEEGKYKKPDVKIVVTYVSSNRIETSRILDGWNNMDATDLIASFEETGFTNIVTNEIITTDQGMGGRIKTIFLNGVQKPYVDGECFLPANSKIEIHYYRYMIPMFSKKIDMIGDNYNNIQNQFVQAGFLNVQVKEGDYENWMPGGAVVSVLIDGNDEYAVGDMIEPDAEVVIYYNRIQGKINVTDIISNWNTKNWSTIRQKLHDLGIQNIEIDTVITDDPKENLNVCRIDIYGKQFYGEECYVEKDTPIRITHYLLKIRMLHPSTYYVENSNLNYQDVRREFESMGFTTVSLRRSDDLDWIDWNNLEGTIKSISIGGITTFHSGDMFEYNRGVRIVIYTKKGSGCEDVLIPE